MVFDKTGTLTEGEFGVAGMETVEGWDEARALALAAAIEGDSEHLIARGIRRRARERLIKPVQVSEFEAIKGRWIKAHYGHQAAYVGGPRLIEMLEAQVPEGLRQFAEKAGRKGQSVVYLLEATRPVAAFALADVVRPESKLAVERLGRMGIEVAMVGDGVNDAPALTRADVEIAVGSETDVAIESAGIVLIKSKPLDVVKVFTLSRASYNKMVQNLLWATGYNVIALPLAAGALAWAGLLLSPAAGALLMSLSTVMVALNAQLLRRTRF